MDMIRLLKPISKVLSGNMNEFTFTLQLYKSPHFPMASPNLAFLTLKIIPIKMLFDISLFSKRRGLMLEHRALHVSKFKGTLLPSASTATSLSFFSE